MNDPKWSPQRTTYRALATSTNAWRRPSPFLWVFLNPSWMVHKLVMETFPAFPCANRCSALATFSSKVLANFWHCLPWGYDPFMAICRGEDTPSPPKLPSATVLSENSESRHDDILRSVTTPLLLASSGQISANAAGLPRQKEIFCVTTSPSLRPRTYICG